MTSVCSELKNASDDLKLALSETNFCSPLVIENVTSSNSYLSNALELLKQQYKYCEISKNTYCKVNSDIVNAQAILKKVLQRISEQNCDNKSRIEKALCFVSEARRCLKCTDSSESRSDNCIIITNQDFKTSDELISKPYIIDKPGKYCFGENIIIQTLEEDSEGPAIVISSSDVILDLCGYEFRQSELVDLLAFQIGIGIINEINDITIIGSNGAVRNFGYGIFALGENNNIHIGESNSSLYVTDNYFVGMQLGLTELSDGITVGPMRSLTVENVICDRNGAYGLSLGNNIDTLLKNSSFSYNSPTVLTEIFGPLSAYGLDIEAFSKYLDTEDFGYENLTIDTCRFNHNSGTSGYSGGLNINNPGDSPNNTTDKAYPTGKGLFVRNSQFNNNGTFSTKFVANGRYDNRGCTLGGGGSAVFENCQFCNNFGPGAAEGFHQSGFIPLGNGKFFTAKPEGLVLRNCVASNNTSYGSAAKTIGTQRAAGFLIAYIAGTLIENCVAEHNKCFGEGNTTITSSVGSGIIILGSLSIKLATEDIVVKNCHLTNNWTDVNFGQPRSAGIYSAGFLQSNISILDCVISNNQNLVAALGLRIEGGLVLRSDAPEKYFSIKGCTISNHKQGFGINSSDGTKTNVQNNEISNNQTGVFFGTGSECSSVLNNTFLHNNLAVKDLSTQTTPSTILVGSNQAFDNGLGTTNTTYDVWYAFGPAPVTVGDLTTGFPAVPSVSLQNVQMNGACTPLIKQTSYEVVLGQEELKEEEPEKLRKINIFNLIAIKNPEISEKLKSRQKKLFSRFKPLSEKTE